MSLIDRLRHVLAPRGLILGATVREDYRRFDMGRMRHWGYNAFWWPEEAIGKCACMFGPTPRTGDVLVVDETVYVITAVDTPRDPGDQHFVDVTYWGSTGRLPESTYVDHGWIT